MICSSIIPCYTIITRNRKIVWKQRPYFCLNLKYLGWSYRAYIKTVENTDFCEELLSENGFKAVLATFCCYDHGAKVSETVQKIATDQKEYRKCSLCVIICLIVKDTSNVAKKAVEVAQKKNNNNWPMVSFLHNGSEITTWMGYSFKTESTKCKATFLRQQHLFLNFKLLIIRLAQGHWSCMPTH